MKIQQATLDRIKSILRWTTIIIIVGFMILMYVDHNKHPEKYLLIKNESREGWTTIDYDCDAICPCPERLVLDNILYWLGIMKRIGFVLAAIFLVTAILDNEKIMKVLSGVKDYKEDGDDDEHNKI